MKDTTKIAVASGVIFLGGMASSIAVSKITGKITDKVIGKILDDSFNSELDSMWSKYMDDLINGNRPTVD